MRFIQHCRALVEWYRALRSLRRILATMACLALLVLPAACADGEATTASGAQATLVIANVADHGAWYVRTRHCGTRTWGADLARTQVIPAGMSRTFSIAPGCADVRVETTSALGGRREWSGRTLEPGQSDTLRLDHWIFD